MPYRPRGKRPRDRAVRSIRRAIALPEEIRAYAEELKQQQGIHYITPDERARTVINEDRGGQSAPTEEITDGTERKRRKE